MCRAVWVVVAAAHEEGCKRLRRALGSDAQVVAMTTSADEALAVLPSSNADAVVISSDLDGAVALAVRARESGAAVLWVGSAAPDEAHHATEDSDDLSGALTRALLARRSA